MVCQNTVRFYECGRIPPRCRMVLRPPFHQSSMPITNQNPAAFTMDRGMCQDTPTEWAMTSPIHRVVERYEPMRWNEHIDLACGATLFFNDCTYLTNWYEICFFFSNKTSWLNFPSGAGRGHEVHTILVTICMHILTELMCVVHNKVSSQYTPASYTVYIRLPTFSLCVKNSHCSIMF